MGKKYVIDETTLTNITDKLRDTMGIEEKYTPEEIPRGIENVFVNGQENGMQTEYDAFWDAFQHNGKRKDYTYGFYSYEYDGDRTWSDANFVPKYDINPTAANFMFNALAVKNLRETLQKLGITIDFSNATTLRYLFNRSTTKKVPVIDGSGVTASNGLERVFAYSSIQEVEKFIVADNGISFTNTFLEATKLHTITFEGVIGKSINFAQSPLTRASAVNVMEHLKNISGTGTTLTVTFSSTTKALLTDEDKAIATQRCWTIA